MDPRVRAWLDRDPDPETRAELETLVSKGDRAEIERRFRARLEFGTAGLRGVLGAGPARMNRLVVRETSAGLGAYLQATVPDAMKRGVVVAHDARRLSKELARDTACVLSAMGFKVFMYSAEVPTPLGAFAVRELSAAAGVVVTASHNPPEYNGYKVYWHNGAQIIPPHDRGIAAAVDKAATAPIPFQEQSDAERGGRVRRLGDEMVAKYLQGVAGLSVRRGSPARAKYPIAYTPLHGVGARVAEAALAQAGFANVRSVAAQREPDPAFPTVRFPNPEEPGAMDLVIGLAREMGAALALANDPDADRLAVAALRPDGQYRRLTGDQVGALLGAELLAQGGKSSVVVSTIVSSRLLAVMTRKAGLRYVDTLTGFKWIADAGLAAEAEGGRFLFGYEEALGYTIGALVRDKDGISALVIFAELAAALADDGKTIFDRLTEIYREYGFFLTGQRTLALDPERPGPSLGDRLRHKPPTRIAGFEVEVTTDVRDGARVLRGGRRESVPLPQSDVLIYELEGGRRVIVRPSGTEPKLKCYYEVCEPMSDTESFMTAEARAERALAELANRHQQELATLST
ncbi:MAG: phospho-sugar mutase [Deltaproteobacteria bacterium]|nr:phospho-sugar mutase [Deltaproteobacteria bacterium]